MSKYIKISKTGEQLPDDATEWVAVLDAKTNLMWQRDRCVGRYKWDEIGEAADFINEQGLAGFNDWRVPTIDELKSLVVKGRMPAIDSRYFPSARDSYFWSSSPYAFYSSFAWNINFNNGHDHAVIKPDAGFVRLVRGPTVPPQS